MEKAKFKNVDAIIRFEGKSKEFDMLRALK